MFCLLIWSLSVLASLMLQRLLLWNDFLYSLQNVFYVHFISKLLLLMFQEDPLQKSKQNKKNMQFQCRGSSCYTCETYLCSSDVRRTNLVSWSDNKHSPKDEALPVHVALVTRLPGPKEVPPHAEAKESQTSHPSLQWSVEMFLQTYILKKKSHWYYFDCFLLQVRYWLAMLVIGIARLHLINTFLHRSQLQQKVIFSHSYCTAAWTHFNSFYRPSYSKINKK